MRTVLKKPHYALLVILLVLLGSIPVQADSFIKWEQTRGPFGGMIKTLANSPHEPDTIYAGTLSGVYKSTNAGDSWTHLTHRPLECPEINALAIDPINPSIVYAGGSKGLFRTTDAGESWTQLGSGLTSDYVLSLAIDPLQPQVLYAGVNGSVFKSSDRGNRWLLINRGLPQVLVWSLAIDPSNPQSIYAGTDIGFYVSDDGGDSWYPANQGLPGGERIEAVAIDSRLPPMLYAGTPRGFFLSMDRGANWVPANSSIVAAPVSSIAPAPSVENVLYANLGLATIWKSTDRGINWSALRPFDRSRLVLSMIVHPQDPQRIYVGTNHGFFKSTDGGETWQASSEGLVSSGIRAIEDVPGTKDQLYVATQQGIYQTVDGGKTWLESNNGLSNLNTFVLEIDPDNVEHMYTSTWEGEIYRSVDGGAHWTLVRGPLTQGSQLTGLVVCRQHTNEDDINILYAGTDGAGVWRSLDLGQSWERLASGLLDSNIGAIWRSPGKQQFVYVGASKDVYRLSVGNTPKGALTWERLTAQPLNGRVTSILADPNKHSDIYVCTDGGGVFRSEGGGAQWHNLARDELPSNLRVEALALVPRKKSAPLMCAITDGGIFCSSDQGETWPPSSTGCLHDANARCVATDDQRLDVVYLGTARSGVYRGINTTKPISPLMRYIIGGVILIGLLGTGEVVRRQHKKQAMERQRGLFEQNWETWNQMIADTLLTYHRVTPDLLPRIPAQAQIIAMRRYMDMHRDQDIRFQQDPPLIEPASGLPLQHFVNNWNSLQDRLDSMDTARPIAIRLTEQLCDLLGFSALENRTFKSLFGYMVKAPALRLSIPPRFPIIFLLKRDLSDKDVGDVRDLMRVLNATSFFALLVVVDAEPGSRESAKELRRLVRSGADDFIVLDYHDLCSLFLAMDAEHQLIKLILAQVDLSVVSPYVVSGPVSENMFFGRDYELKAIMRTVRDHSFAIVGGRRIGKTSVLTKVHRLMEQTSGFSAFYLDCQPVLDYREFFDALAIKCQVRVDSTSPDVLRRIIVRLRRRNSGTVIVLLLDEVDNLLKFDIQNQIRLFRVFRALSQEGICRFVFCGERELNRALHDPESPLFNFCNITRLSYLLSRDARRIIQGPMSDMGVSFEDPEALPDEIIKLSSCHPNVVQFICQMLIVRVNARNDRTIRMDDLEQVQKSNEFRDFFLEVTWGNASTLERLITVLMVNMPSFTLSDVKQALVVHGHGLANAEIEAALDGLVLFSILQKQGNQYSFAARSFPGILTEANLAEGLLEGLLETLRIDEEQT